MQIEALKANKYKTAQSARKTGDDNLNKTLKGVLINTHVASNQQDNEISFDEIQDSLLIVNKPKYYSPKEVKEKEKDESSFNANKAMKPLLIGTGLLLAGSFGLSAIFKQSSKTLLKAKSFECLPDLAINNNIKQEPQFAIYRAIRDPNFKNVFGAAAVFIMSGITIACKNFVDGAKEIWLKKKSSDVEKNLQENLIKVETNSFSGKLKVVNDLLAENVKYFDSVLNKKQEQTQKPHVFAEFISFKGDKKDNQEQKTNKKPHINDEVKKNLKYILLTGGIIAGAFILGKMSIANLRQTAKNTNNLANNIADNTINLINEKAKNPNEADLPSIIEWLKAICAKPAFIKDIGEKYNLTDDKIQSIINEVEKEKKMIFANAPEALGGIPQKLQYYCYIDENRGHLYNWILHPENKFTKYIFMSFTLSSAIGYLFKQGMDAIKEVTVMRENAKTELKLRQRLVDTEIRNFKSKKESAIKPLIDKFNEQTALGTKSKEELKQLADNILSETKNGPPYVYT